VLALDADPNMPTTKFDVKMPTPVARKRIEAKVEGIDQSDIDWILVEVTGKKRGELGAISHLTATEYESAMKIADKMAGGKPLQYALGNTEFYGIRLAVNEAVLIPRPETELLAEKAINTIKEKGYTSCHDLCTGSGAIAIAIAKNTSATVSASDVSSSALEIAKANVLSSGAKVKCYLSDMFKAVDGKFDVIVSNPPYIPTKDIESLDKKVKDFEPNLALDGGADGLHFYREIAKNLDNYLNEGGTLFLEFGIGQGQQIKEIFSAYSVEIFKDLEGIERMAVVTRN
jgi:release factor glutamine methyltransferase